MNKISQIISLLKIVLQNHFRICLNWYLHGSNRIVILLSLIIFIPIFLFFINIVDTITETIFAKNIILIFISVYLTHLYSKLTLAENNFLLSFISEKKVLLIKLILTLVSNFIIYFILILFSYLADVNLLSSFAATLSSIMILVVISIMPPFLIKEKKSIKKVLSSSKLWDSKITNKNFLPIRGTFLRELLSLMRENKHMITKYILFVIVLNFFSVLFILNNNKEDFFIWAIILQFVFLLSFVLTYPTSNNLKLLNISNCYSLSILKGEFIFWSLIFLLHLILAGVFYSFFLANINYCLLFLVFILILFLLTYTLLVRLAYADNEPTRLLVFIMLFVPITIPYTIYNSFRKLKC